MDNGQISPQRAFVLRVYGRYFRLLGKAPRAHYAGIEPGLGGLLVFAGEMDEEGRALVAAANIAGAASLSATPMAAGQREALREGIVDFVVNSLDEALRILKNEVRKKEAVSVCVARAVADVELEMNERGVLPDIRRADLPSDDEPQVPGAVLVEWTVSGASAVWLPRLDILAAECLAPSAPWLQRWLRLFPRYVGRSARTIRLVRSTPALAACFLHQVQSRLEAEEWPIAVCITVSSQEGTRRHEYLPRLQPK